MTAATKIPLRDLVWFLSSLAERCRHHSGEVASEAWIRLSPDDAAHLDQAANVIAFVEVNETTIRDAVKGSVHRRARP